MTALILIAMAMITLYAIVTTIKLGKMTEKMSVLERLLELQTEYVERYRKNVIDTQEKFMKERAELNEEVFRLNKENKRHLEINAKLMGRLKKVTQ